MAKTKEISVKTILCYKYIKSDDRCLMMKIMASDTQVEFELSIRFPLLLENNCFAD